MHGLLLPVRQDFYAVGLAAVREVLELAPDDPLTPLPAGPQGILGLVNVRGQVVPVVDTAALLGLDGLGRAGVAALTVVRVARGFAALASTALPSSQELGEALGPSPLAGATERRRIGDRVCTVLDLEAFLAPERVRG